MSKLTWDGAGKRTYEVGVSNGVLYPLNPTSGEYTPGVAWNGLTNVTESPTGAEASPYYADNIKYLNLISLEEFEASLECYTYPDEFNKCDGSAELAEGVMIGQQDRQTFGMCYKTILGNDTKHESYGYKLHLIYGCLASPSEKSYDSINDSVEPIAFSYEITTTPVPVSGHKATANLTIDSTKVSSTKLTQLENILYGTATTDPRLPLPDEVASIFR